MSISGTSWEKIEIKRIPSIPDGPDLPNGPKRPRKLIPAVFDPRSADADSDGWRQEGTTARWYGLLPSNPIYKNVLANFKKIKDPERDKSWLPLGHENLEEWLGTIVRSETPRLKAPAVELSTLEADLSFIAGQIDTRARLARERGVDAPNIANESRRAAAWVKGREIQRRRLGKSEQVLGDGSMSALEKAEALIDELKKKRIERDKKMAKFAEIDEYTRRLISKLNLSDFIVPTIDDYDLWSEDWKANNPMPNRGDYATEELFQDAIDAWQTRMDLDYEDAKISQESNEELNDYLDEIFSFSYTSESGNEYSISFQYADQLTEDSVTLHFSIYTSGTRSDGIPSGEPVGSATRVLNISEGSVYNDNMRIYDQFRGDQISTAMAARNEQIFALLGVDQIEVSAASSQSMNGATHWPKVGFNWKDPGEREYFIDQIEEALNYFSAEIQDNPDELPMVWGIRNGQDVSIPLFASREEAEILMSLVQRARSERFDEDEALTAGDLVNWSGAEFWFMTRGMIVSLVKPIGGSSGFIETKWLVIESETKAVNKPNKPNLPNAPNKPSIGSGKPSAPRALKPAVFDPRSVDVDNDGWHQEGTTAAWFGAGLNNPIVQQLKEQMEKLTDDDADSSMEMARSGTWGLYEGAPKVEDSTDEADLAWLGGRILQQQQQQKPSGMFGGPPPRGMTSTLESEAQWLHGRQKIRERGGVREEVIPTPKIEQLKDEDVVAVLEKTATARKERRAIIDGKTRVRSDDMVTEEVRTAARDFDHTKHPTNTDVEILDYDQWKEKYVEEPEIPDYPFTGTAEEREAWEQAQRDYLDLMAGKWDEYVEYKRAQEDLKDAELKKAFAPLFEVEFTANDGKTYSTRVDRVTQEVETDDDGYFITVINVKGQFYNEDGLAVGVFDRSFAPEKKLVIHEHLKLEPEARGSQISGIFNSRNEIIYREMGYDTISVGALSSGDYNGATHWPKVGFDWANEDEREAYLGVVEDALTEFAVAIKSDPDALPMLAKITEDADGNPITTEVPIFASREEAESVALLIALAREQDFDDPSRLTSGDFVNWPGAERWFQQRSHQAELSRSLGEIEDAAQGANAPDADAPNVDAPSGGMSAEEIKEKNQKILNKIAEGGVEFGTAHPIVETFADMPDDAPEKQFGSLVTTEQRAERRREVMNQTLDGLKIYLETKDEQKAQEVGNWDDMIWHSEGTGWWSTGTSLREYDSMSPELKKFILETPNEELIAIIEDEIFNYFTGLRDGETGVVVPQERIFDLLEIGEYKTQATIQKEVQEGISDGSMASSNASADLRAMYEVHMGLGPDVDPEIRPASGYIVHQDQLAIEAEIAKRRANDIRRQGLTFEERNKEDEARLEAFRNGEILPIPELETTDHISPNEARGDLGMYGGVHVILKPEVRERMLVVRGDAITQKSAPVPLYSDDKDAVANSFINYQYEGSGRGERVVSRMLSALEARRSGDRSKITEITGYKPTAPPPYDQVDGAREYVETFIPGSFQVGEIQEIVVDFGRIPDMPSGKKTLTDDAVGKSREKVLSGISKTELADLGASEEEIEELFNFAKDTGKWRDSNDAISNLTRLQNLKDLRELAAREGVKIRAASIGAQNPESPEYYGGNPGSDVREVLLRLAIEQARKRLSNPEKISAWDIG